ncbi:metalloendopeptidase [Brachybacterium vulturis]|uniref:Metalloendopeptidase n=1 Tax=Brachybacterium vulturis TaxID=2017484 RepID=A0A291GNN0_9MICO|nr:M23 family metallopeptidase [Brachybacterium vulturis]ATG51682.1 metalloendopeptidase [Brachybacterium vulturis]
MRKHRLVGGTHRDSVVSAGAVKVGVLGVLATATIAAPLAAAAAGIDEAAPQGETIAQAQPAAPAAQAPAPVALPVADVAAEATAETRPEDADASRSEARTAPAPDDSEKQAEASEDAASTGIEVSVPEPVEEASAAEPVGDNGYVRPVSGPITSGFGGRMHPVLGYFKGHDGVDFGASCGTPVAAARAGTVIAVEYHHASGNRVKIDHGNGVVTGYYHLQGFNTLVGATVAAGETIGYVGSTGRSTGCHLHFAKMDEAGNYSNPMTILR